MRKKIVWIGLTVLVTGVVLALLLPYNPSRLSYNEIQHKAVRIYERAAIVVPHHELAPDTIRDNNIEAFQSVEYGDSLTWEMSKSYRLAYQTKLQLNQGKLGFFDGEFSVVEDVGMATDNNMNGKGIIGYHDHHDISVRENLKEILKNLEYIESEDVGFFRKIKSITFSYKDASDILQHLATVPQTKSIKYNPPKQINSKTEELVEATMKSFKEAQFTVVNSQFYYKKLNLALTQYSSFILHLQEIIFNNTTPFQRSIAGSWNSWKSFGTEIDQEMIVRDGINLPTNLCEE